MKKDPCAAGCPRGCEHDRNTKKFPQHTPGLIAAAPDLYKTAVALNQAIYDVQMYEMPQPIVDAVLKLRTAIAKAEGR